MAEDNRQDFDRIADKLSGQIEQRLAEQARAYEYQAEAYERVSEALIKINSEIQALDEKASDLRSETKSHLKDLVKGVITIGSELRNHHSTTRDSDMAHGRRLDDLIRSVSQFLSTSEEREKTLTNLVHTVTSCNVKISEQLMILEQDITTNTTVLAALKEKVEKMHKVSSIVGWALTGVGILWTVTQGLVQLGVWKITWFGK